MAIHAARGDVRDRGLAAAGEDLIERAARAMPVLLAVRRRFQRERPLAGLRVAARLQVTSGTANLVLALRAAGADVALCASARCPRTTPSPPPWPAPGLEFASAEEAVARIAPRRLSGTLTAPRSAPAGEPPP